MSRRLRHATDILAGLDEGPLLPALDKVRKDTGLPCFEGAPEMSAAAG